MGKVFVSYRRNDSKYAVRAICDHLVERFGKRSVFFDIDSIPVGEDFRQQIWSHIDQCDVLLAVIGPSWSSITDKQGKLRLFAEYDFVRMEIERALDQEIFVVPVLLEGAKMPGVDQLPDSLNRLPFANCSPVRDGLDFKTDIDRLTDAVTRQFKKRRRERVQVFFSRLFAAGRATDDQKPQADESPETPNHEEMHAELSREVSADIEPFAAGTCDRAEIREQLHGIYAERGELWHQAAIAGIAAGQWLMSCRYAFGIGTARNDKSALQWLNEAAGQQFAMAEYDLAIRYQRGLGVKKDEFQAALYLRRAALHGHRRAREFLRKRRRQRTRMILVTLVRSVAQLPFRLNAVLKTCVAGDDYPIVFRFLQFVLYVCVPVIGLIAFYLMWLAPRAS